MSGFVAPRMTLPATASPISAATAGPRARQRGLRAPPRAREHGALLQGGQVRALPAHRSRRVRRGGEAGSGGAVGPHPVTTTARRTVCQRVTGNVSGAAGQWASALIPDQMHLAAVTAGGSRGGRSVPTVVPLRYRALLSLGFAGYRAGSTASSRLSLNGTSWRSRERGEWDRGRPFWGTRLSA